ncbi:DUF305 domain-containing protein [Dietzia sp. ANT_WB102]|uniref:DUF305 domain-containing protein n=1 Tax=Dietzia sp. ANT_WB102 TaxID=2597345 RepID=UPI0011ED3DFF|nr:DUF305 domain-containing protein [Dietzia sp. ANT_WB102]KAA0916513.1 DUF305 domain-containing protein [Dietzia sp. ANT_WB102]
MNRTPLLLSAAIAAILALSGCASDSDDTGAVTTSSASASSVGESTTEVASEATRHNEADVMFAQMMTPHHQQAIEMSDIILAKDAIPTEVIRLAGEIKAAQGPEIDQLTEWLGQWGEPIAPDGGHEMAQMDGMLSDDELAQLSEAEGAGAARLFLEQMIGHHEGAVTMAEDEIADGSYQPAVDLARTIITTQQEEIDTMRGLLDSL